MLGIHTIGGSRKYPYPPHGGSLEILRGWGFQKLNKGKYNEALPEFPKGWEWGWGFEPKTIHGGVGEI